MTPPGLRRLRGAARLIEAWLLLGVARATILVVTLERLAPHLGHVVPIEEAAGDPVGTTVGRAVARAARRTPWWSSCYAQALAGHWMLRRRRTASTLWLGVDRAEDGLRAHAWLAVASGIAVGAAEAATHHPIVGYRWDPR